MKTTMLKLLVAATLLSLSALHAAESVQFPDSFRHWVHVGTGVILSGANPQLKSEEGVHHIFANEKAIDGYSSGDFSDGSIIVYELREAQQKNGVIFEGDRKRVDVMIKDSSLKDTRRMAFRTVLGERSDAECHSRLGHVLLSMPFECECIRICF